MSFCQEAGKDLTWETTIACSSCLITARADLGLLNMAGWLLSPKSKGETARLFLPREKGRALASWARVSCIYQRQEEWEADISPSCSGPVEIPMLSLCRGKLASQVSGMNKHCTLPFCSSCCLQEQTQCLGAVVWCCWSLSHGSEFSCDTSALHLPSLIVMGVPVQKGAGEWMLSSAVQWQAGLLHSAAVAAASLSQWEVICGDGLGVWHRSEGNRKETLGNAEREVLSHLLCWTEQINNTFL